MKKLGLILVTMLFVGTGCDSEDEVDDILYNTKWEYQTTTSVQTGEEVSDSKEQTLINLINNKIVECSSVVERKGEERYRYYEPYLDPHMTNILIQFHKNGTCTYSRKLYNKKEVSWSIYNTYTLKEQEPNESNSFCRVTSDGIYGPNSYLYMDMRLNDFKLSCSIRTENREEIEYLENIEEKMNFVRTENEIIMTNGNRRLYAVLNKEEWTLKVTQLEPKKEEMRTLYLK